MTVMRLEKDEAGGEQGQMDEIKRYVVGRYISASEAYWRFFGYGVHDEYSTVVPLTVHLLNEQV